MTIDVFRWISFGLPKGLNGHQGQTLKNPVPNGSHMGYHEIYDFKCIFNLEPRAVNMLQASRHLNPALNRRLPLINEGTE